VEWRGGFSGDFGGFDGAFGGDLPAFGGEMGRTSGGGTGDGLSRGSGGFGDGFTDTDLVVILARKKLQKFAKKWPKRRKIESYWIQYFLTTYLIFHKIYSVLKNEQISNNSH
jgi:hypothetical protein